MKESSSGGSLSGTLLADHVHDFRVGRSAMKHLHFARSWAQPRLSKLGLEKEFLVGSVSLFRGATTWIWGGLGLWQLRLCQIPRKSGKVWVACTISCYLDLLVFGNFWLWDKCHVIFIFGFGYFQSFFLRAFSILFGHLRHQQDISAHQLRWTWTFWIQDVKQCHLLYYTLWWFLMMFVILSSSPCMQNYLSINNIFV